MKKLVEGNKNGILPTNLDKVKEEGRTFQKEVRDRTLGFITAGLSLVVGLAWNDAIKALIEYLFPLDKDSIPAKFIYAVLLSVIVVVFSTYLVRLLQRRDQESLSPSPPRY